jgi:D-sedoheptulose 7-phosphate isomerase
MESSIKKSLFEHLEVATLVARDEALTPQIAKAARTCIECLRKGGKIFFVGNGGSAADAQHLAGELVSRFYYDRPALCGIALTVDTSVLTAIGNDYGYVEVFQRQMQGLARAGDVLVALTTSGNSPNILKAVEWSNQNGVATIGLTGRSGGKLVDLAGTVLRVPSASTPRIQEMHIVLGHILCALIEEAIFPEHNPARQAEIAPAK